MQEMLKDIEDILAVASINTRYFSKLFLGEMFSSPFHVLHDEILKVVDSGSKRCVIAAPRGIGKTTIVKALIMREILFRKVHFVVYISKSATMAEMQTENIKNELMSNREIKKIFGDIRVNYYTGSDDETFSKKSWVAFGDVFVLPRGAGQQVRGLNWRNYRPDLIIVDDLEDKKTVKNEQLRHDLKVWFFGDVMKSVDIYGGDWRVIYIDTLKHQDSLLQTLLDDPSWNSTVLSVCDEDLRSIIPDYISDEEIKAEYERALMNGVVETFFMEYMNKAVGTKHAPFQAEYFKYYEEDSEFFKKLLEEKSIETVILVDPAKTTHSSSADTAIVVVGVDLKGNRLFVRDIVNGQMHPDEMFEHIFVLADRYNVRVIGIEDAGLKEFITYPFQNEMLRRGRIYEVINLIPRRGVEERGKVERIRSLIPFYRQGLVYHNKNVANVLESQLLSFPSSKKWDVMDCFAYITELLDVGGRFFYPTDEYVEDEELIEKEYEELEVLDEPPLEGWQII